MLTEQQGHKKNAINNVIYGMLGQLITIALGVVIPRLVLTNLGSEANGLMNSINSAISYLILLEAGVGTATLQSLYKPVACGNIDRVNGVMAATHYFYKRTATFYLAGVVIISVFYGLAVSSTLQKGIVFCVAMLSGLPGVIGYFLQGKYKILLQVQGKGYILTNITTVSTIATSFGKIILLNAGFGILALQILYFAISMVQVIVVMILIKQKYAWLNLNTEPDFSALQQKNSALIHQVSTLIFNSTDMLVLTVFCDLKVVSVYAMYNMLFAMLKTAMSNIGGSVSFAMGQAFHRDRQRFLQMHHTYELWNMTLTFACFTTANLFLCPFLQLYTKGVTDANYLDATLAWLFVLCNILANGRVACLQVISFAGHFKQTLSKTILESAINLVLSVVLAQKLGIYGVLLGTIAALLYRTNDMIWYAAKRILHISVWHSYRRWIVHGTIYLGIMAIASCVRFSFSGYAALVAAAGAVFVIILLVYTLANFILEKQVTLYFCRALFSRYLEKIGRKQDVERQA